MINRAVRRGEGSSLRGLTMLLWAWAAAACGAPEDGARATGPDTVRIVLSRGLSQAPMALAIEGRYFEAAGIVPVVVTIRRETEVLVALIEGQADVAIEMVYPGYLGAMVRGAPVRFVTSTVVLDTTTCPYVAAVLRPGLSPGEAPAVVRTVRTTSTSTYRYLLERALVARGIDTARVQLLEVGIEASEQALREGRLDAAVLSEPALSRAERDGARWFSLHEGAGGMAIGGLLFGKRLVEGPPDLGTRFLAAYRRGVAQYLEGKTPANVEALSRFTALDATTLAQACWPAFRDDGRLDPAGILGYQDWAIARGFLDTPARVDQFWDSSFVAASDALRFP